MSADWSAVKALFEAALALPAEQRPAFVQAAEVPAAVRDEVLSLLAHATQGTAGGGGSNATGAPAALAGAGFLGGPALAAVAADTPAAPAGAAGQRLGAWELVAPLGSGGMGEVWLARRADGAYTGEAAVKLLKRGMDSGAVLQRFAQERQALARLAHPHIARLYDAGLSPQGLPYFVMERVQGEAIDQAAARLGLPQRLGLFLQLADAVAHAHRNLLVHRDLKPSNVMVDASGQVKLLDFGIAKALDPAADGQPLDATRADARPFTPTHASPEQVRGEPVGTATDVYSLGVLLYQLLTGQRPYGRDAHSPQEAARAVLDEAPTRPSSLQPREGDDAWLRHRERLRGDLDNILLKALEKEPARRYATVEDFARDVQAYLGGHPVSAHAPSRAYLWGKFVRRNRLAVGLAAGALLAVLGGSAATAWQAHQARLAQARAEHQLAAVQRITSDLVFRFGDALSYVPGGAKAQDALLAETLAALESLATQAPEAAAVQALVASTLARRAELRLNDTSTTPEQAAEGRAWAQRAVALGDTLWATMHTDWRFAQWHARALDLLANLARNEGDPKAGLPLVRRAIERLEQARPHAEADVSGRAALGVDLANSLMRLAQLHSSSGPEGVPEALAQLARAEPVYRAMLADEAMQAEVDRRAAPGEMRARHYLQHQLGTLLASRALAELRRDHLEDALAAVEQAMPLREATVAAEPKNIAFVDGLTQEAHLRAQLRLRLGDVAGGAADAHLAWRQRESLAREHGPQSKWAAQERLFALVLARAQVATGEPAAALAVSTRAQAAWEATRTAQNSAGVDRRRAALARWQAEALHALGRRSEALVAARAALQPLQAQVQADQRDALLIAADLHAWRAQVLPAAEAGSERQLALAALERAAQAQPLASDHQALRQRLAGPPGAPAAASAAG